MSNPNFIEDIILKRNRSNAKKEFEQFFKFIFNNIRDGISILDIDLNIIGVNSLIEKWFSHKIPFIGRKCYEVYHNRSKPCVGCPTLKSIRERKTATAMMRYDEPDREKNWHEIYSFPMYDEDNRVTAIIEYIKDPSEKNHYDKAVMDLKKRLNFQEQTLSDQEIALKVLLEKSKQAEDRVSENLVYNINNSLKPMFDTLKSRLGNCEELKYIEVIEKGLEDITSPFLKKLSSGGYEFTPRESQIASLIREGKKNKEIAEILHISLRSVCFHRMNIRKKLKLVNSRTNLQSYLLKL